MSQRFIKFIHSERAEWLLANHPNAFLLLSLIALRARRFSGHIDGFEIGWALVGDYESAGLTRKKYRTALDVLIDLKIIEIIQKSRNIKKSAIKRAIRGTIVKLIDSTIWDINPENEGHQEGQRGAIKGPRTRKNKKEEEEPPPQSSSINGGVGVKDEKNLSQEEITILDECMKLCKGDVQLKKLTMSHAAMLLRNFGISLFKRGFKECFESYKNGYQVKNFPGLLETKLTELEKEEEDG